MTTIRQLVTDAFREAGIISVGETPEADQFDEGLRRLQNMLKSLFGHELGEPLQTVNFGKAGLTNSYAKDEDRSSEIESVYIPNNIRLVFNVDGPETLYLTPNPQDGTRVGVIDNGGNLTTYNVILNGNGRKIELANSVTLATNSINREWFYRGDLGNWVRVTDPAAGDESPLPGEFDDLLITLLAFRLNSRYGAETSNEMIEILKRMRKLFRARYRQSSEQNSEMGLYRLTSNVFWQSGNSLNTFNRGRFGNI